MSILFLQPPYSFFFNEIGKKLKENKANCLSISFTLGDLFLKKDLKNFLFWREIKKIKIEDDLEEKISEIIKIENLYFSLRRKIDKESLTFEEKKYFYKYYKFLECFINKNNIKLILMMNDLRWQHVIAIHLAKKYNIKYFVFELGLFRPNTITMDKEGVNYNNSLSQDIKSYKNSKEIKKFDYTKIDSKITENQRNRYIIIYILLNKMDKILGIKNYNNNRSTILDYFKRYKRAYLTRKIIDNQKEIDGDYIFVPLQVKTDTQTLIHSDYNNMIEFMEDVIRGTSKYRKKYSNEIKLVFKEHPMDQGRVFYGDFYNKYMSEDWIVFLKTGNTREILKKSKLVITINSTVGLEAIEEYKPIISMGRAFYNIDGISIKSNQYNLSEDIKRELNRVIDKNLIDNFLNYLKYEYSLEGNLYYYNETYIDNISDKIIKYLKYDL